MPNVLTAYIQPEAKRIQKANPKKPWPQCIKEASAKYRKMKAAKKPAKKKAAKKKPTKKKAVRKAKKKATKKRK